MNKDRIYAAILLAIYFLMCKIVATAYALYPFSVAALLIYLVYMIIWFIWTLVYGKS